MNLDIETAVRTIFVLLLIGSAFIFILAWRRYREAQRILFFIKKQKIVRSVWGLFFTGLLIVVFAFAFNHFSEPIAYLYFPPSPTATLTPTQTMIPTITGTPTITMTPTITFTPLFTPTPFLPAAIRSGFTSSKTPNPDAVFSMMKFSRKLGINLMPIEPQETFSNPIITLYGTFTYDRMIRGSQWTALWFRDGELIYFESLPWNGESGGYGFTETNLSPEEWLPGRYEVQIFVGETWKISGNFEVIGEPFTPTPTPTVTPTQTPTNTPTSTLIPTRTLSPTSTATPTKTKTLTPTASVQATFTPTPTVRITLKPSSTPK